MRIANINQAVDKKKYDENFDRIFGVGYKEVPSGSHIWLVTNLPDYLPGWYFSDETEQFNGPFNTKEEAETNLADYCEWLDGKHGYTREPDAK